MTAKKAGTSVTDCNFVGVKFDGQAIHSIDKVAQALLNITELFKAQNIHIDAMLSVSSDGPAKFVDCETSAHGE